ncbi:NifU family protein [Streptosporangium sp. NPDC051022]|uniref:NifU family protein n=1 Tax=Streptosporangium sp. NPDC051022 TaxID=3155752 RepID=UPI00342629EF
MSRAHDVRAVGERVEALLAEPAAFGDPAARARAEDLVRALVELYGAGLERIMEIVTEAGAGQVLRALTDDEVVSGLLVLHDLHPLDIAERVRRALEEVRPHLGGHAGDVELVGVGEDDVVRLRLRSEGHACPSSRTVVTEAVERAVMRAAPEASGVAVETVTAERQAPLLQIQRRPPGSRPVPEAIP